MKKIAILLLLFFSSSFLFADKLQLQGNIFHNGQVRDTVQFDTLLWQREVSPIDFLSSPITFGSLIFLPTSRGLFCLNTSGESLWVADSVSFYGTPAIIESNKVVAIKSRSLVCYNFNGQLLWQVSGFPEIPSHPVSGDTIFITCHKKVYAFDSAGNSLWITSNLPYPISRNMTVSLYDSWIVAATIRGPLTIDPTVTIALISRDGQIINTHGYGYGFAEGGGCCTPVISSNNDIHVSNFLPNSLYGFWRAVPLNNPLPSERWEIAGGSYYGTAGTKDSLVFWPGNNLTAISLSGQIRWNASIGRITYSSPLIDATGSIYIGNDASEILKIDRVSGLIQTRIRCGNSPLTAPASTSDGKIIICNLNGGIFCFGPRPVGLIEPQLRQRQKISLPVICDIAGRIVGRRILSSQIPAGVYFKVDSSGVRKIVKFR